MRLTRRHLLALAGLTTAAATAGVGLTLVHWWDQPPEAPYLHVSADEARFLDALAEAVFPTGGTPALGGASASVARYMDLVLSGLVGTQRELIRISMHALDNLARVHGGAAFSDLPADRAEAQIRDWLASPNGVERGLAQSLYLFVVMGYTAHPEVAPILRPWFNCGFGEG